ncbi:MAG TPA: hypothetical protein VMG08_02175 [Allosphingosinicella sp.]|nr:hypothetical protein [Allosphingosinicella sp.]
MVGAGTLFSYLGAFVTIVLALGLSDLLMSFHRLLRKARTVRWAGLPIAAAAFVLLSLLSEFFSMWGLVAVERVSFVGLILHLLPTFFIFLAASAVLPDEVDEEPFDLDAFYFSQQRYFYVTLSLAFLGDAPRALEGVPFDLGEILAIVAPSTVVALIFLTLAVSRRRWLHWLGLGLVFALILMHFPEMVIEAPAALLPPGS